MPAMTTNDRAYTPTINRPTDRQALCLTTIITVAGTVLPPGRTAAMLAANSDLIITALPAAYRQLLLLPAVPPLTPAASTCS